MKGGNTLKENTRTIDNTYAMSKSVQLQVQGQWTRWLNYIQQDFSWAALMAMPPDLTSFCLASTFDTLPLPTNLKRWRIAAEAKCTLCSKDVCTTTHILGACKVSLQKERDIHSRMTLFCARSLNLSKVSF